MELIAAGLLGLAAMGTLQTASPHLPGNDGYYHLRMAALLPEIGFVQTFPWLRWTILSDRFVSHHHGFHVLLSPFVWASDRLVGDAVPGGKIAAAVAMGMTFMIFLSLLRRLGVQDRLVWIFLLCAVPGHFWLRMSYVRAPMAALPLLLLAVLWTIRGRMLAIGLLAFAFTQVYGGGVLFPIVPFALLAGHLLSGEPLRRPIMQCLAALVGVMLGLVLNPYFPANLSFLYTQLFETGLGAPAEVGTEWKPYDAWFLFGQSFVVVVAWGWCLIRRLRAGVPARGIEIGLLVLNAAFLVLTLKARRFVEYWPPFALLNAADFLAVANSARLIPASNPPVPAGKRVGARVDETALDTPLRASPHEESGTVSQELPVADAEGGSAIPGQRRRWPATAALFVVAIIAIGNLRLVRAGIRPNNDVPAIRDAMVYLREHSAPGSLVFTDDWDIFPTCFYFNHHNTYAVGLDPEFTRTRFPGLWERYRKITRAELPATLSPNLADGSESKITYDDVATMFGANYVLVESDHSALYRALTARPERFTRIYPADEGGDKASQQAVALFRVGAD